jgi:hypothetical protein
MAPRLMPVMQLARLMLGNMMARPSLSMAITGTCGLFMG